MAIEKTIKLNIDASESISELKKVRSETDITYAQLRRTIPVDIDATKAKSELKNVAKTSKDLAKDIPKMSTKATKGLDDISKEAEDLSITLPDPFINATKQIETMTEEVEDLGDAMPEVGEGAEKGAKVGKAGFKGMGLAMKAMGIGLIISAFMTLKNALMQNQVVMDKVSIVTESIGFIFQKIIGVAVELGTKVSKAFSDPKQAIEDLWISLKQNIVDRINGLIDTFGALGKVIKGVFKRDLDMIKEGALEAKTGMIQLATGMTEVEQSEFAEKIKEGYEEVKNATKEAVAYGKAISKLKTEVKLAEANQRQIQLVYQKDAELQRQLRDDVSLTFDERIAANTKLGEILNSQYLEEKALANKKVQLAELELSKNKDNIDLQVAVINAKTEMADLDERITGQRSEQLVNEIALEKEKQAVIDENAEKERLRKEAEALQRQTEIEQLRQANLTAQEVELDAARIKYEKLITLAEKYGQDTTILTEKYNQQVLDINEKYAEKEEEIDKLTAETKRSIVAQSLGQVAGLMGAESKAGKALAVAQALINTYSAATAALAPPPVGLGPVFGPIAAIGAVASGMMNVKSILSTKLPDVSDDGGGGGDEPSVPTPPSGLGPLTPNVEAIEAPELGGGATPVQAYVVENDISDAQALQDELELQATL